jgi:hypothetical protein
MRKFALVATLVLASCGGGDDTTEPTTPTPEPPTSDSRAVVLSLDPERPHGGETVTLTVDNRTRWRLEYGVAYRLEHRVEGEWRWINRDAAFILILKVVEAGRREREEIQLPRQLERGRYRIVKSFTAPAVERDFDASVEFRLSGL